MAIASNLTPSEQVRLVLHERMKGRVQQVEGGPWDGVPVITEKDLDVAFGEALPPPSARGVEVQTPARIVVLAVCPRCHIPQQIALFVSPKLEIDDERTTLKLVAKAKSMGHTCGQQPLPLPVEGQTALEDVELDPEPEEAVDDAADDALLPEPDEDVRPAGEVNTDALLGDVDRALDDDQPKRRGRR